MLSEKKLTTTLGIATAVFFSLFLFMLIKPNYCAGTEEDYTNGLKIIEERVIATSIVPINFEKFNEIINNYSACPSEMDCEVSDLKFVNIYGMVNSTEKEKLALITKVIDNLYTEMPFLYDRTIIFYFKGEDNQTNIDVFTILSNKWSRR